METKTVKKIRFFTVIDWRDEQEYLTQQHREGWKFVKQTGNVYTFERCEPEEVVYQIDFKGDDNNREEYLQMFKDCGWEYLQDQYGYSYFRKPAKDMKENEKGIFCDDESRLEMLKNVFRKKVVPLFVVFVMIIIPQLISQSLQAVIHAEEGGAGYWFPKLLSITFIVLFVLYLVLFIKFGVTLRKIKKSMNE